MIEFYIPKPEDLWFREQLLGDPDTMSFNHAYGGTVSFPPDDWQGWHDRWISNGSPDRFYRYLINEEGRFVGEACYHFDDERGVFITDVLVYAPYRRRGYGKAALLLLCRTARKNGIPALYDDIAIDNPSVALFLRCGFAEEYRTDTYIMLKRELTEA